MLARWSSALANSNGARHGPRPQDWRRRQPVELHALARCGSRRRSERACASACSRAERRCWCAPPPGWTKEEVLALKLALEKFGIGRWVQIVDSGVLPGKLIQQLNGQTQRLLGQQSLAGATVLACTHARLRVLCARARRGSRPPCALPAPPRYGHSVHGLARGRGRRAQRQRGQAGARCRAQKRPHYQRGRCARALRAHAPAAVRRPTDLSACGRACAGTMEKAKMELIRRDNEEKCVRVCACLCRTARARRTSARGCGVRVMSADTNAPRHPPGMGSARSTSTRLCCQRP